MFGAFIVWGGALDAPVILQRKITKAVGDNVLFPFGKSEKCSIFRRGGVGAAPYSGLVYDNLPIQRKELFMNEQFDAGEKRPVALPWERVLPFGMRELVFLAAQLVLNLFLWNSFLYGGCNLGFALGAAGLIGCSWWYVGRNAGAYPRALLGFGIVIALGFARADDGFVKYIMAHFLLVAVNLGLCLMAGQNRRSPKGLTSLLDAPRALFVLGFGETGAAWRGIGQARKGAGTAVKKGGAVFLGILLAAPLLVVMVFLLMSADAAFEGLLDLLPDIDLGEVPATLLFGGCIGWVLFTRGTALRHREQPERENKVRRGVNGLTVNTVLIAVCAVYVVYLVSQLAYLSGGLAGILPEGYTLAQYARRGFFEMAWLCGIDLAVMAAGVGLVQKAEKAPLVTRSLCLFIGIVTEFLVVTASAKMFMYIGSYGLTRLRVLTEVIMVFLGLSTAVVCVWLFRPKLAYMKVILLLALAMGTATLWADVDTCVAAYNVRSYQSGKLETVDVSHLRTLGSGAVPYLAELEQDKDPAVAQKAKAALNRYYVNFEAEGFRDWNYADARAAEIFEGRQAEDVAEDAEEVH